MNAILSNLHLFGPGYSGDQMLSLFSNAWVDEVIIQKPEVSPPTTSGRLRWVLPAVRHILQLAALKKNWDGRGSARVSPDALVFVMTLLAQAMPPGGPAPDMVPLGNGGVQLLWATLRAELEVEVIKPNDVYVFYLDRVTGFEREFRATTQFRELSDILWDLFRA
jgi:hypothetical protein